MKVQQVLRKLKNFYHLLRAYYWSAKCGWPGRKLYVIGVTGTDGKTTTATLIYEMLKAAGYRVGIFSTVEVKYVQESKNPKTQKSYEVKIKKGLHTTNPDSSELQPILREMFETGVTHVVMEVTSHGLDQNRVAGVDFQIGVFTNLTHEHLDYHETMQKYAEAKAKLMSKVQFSVLNEDDEYYEYFKKVSGGIVVGYGKTKIKKLSPSLAGEYNRYNIAAAVEAAKILKINDSIIQNTVRNFAGVKGRREEVPNKKGIRVIVDFAHTPNALEKVLTQLRKETKKRLICVFGCTGERDKEKRPIMGEIADRLADIVIVTSDDTRSESQEDIAAQIMAGMKRPQTASHKVFKINDRKEALAKALGLARRGDVVLLAGKGHEKTILHGTTEIPWNDFDEAAKILGAKNAKN